MDRANYALADFLLRSGTTVELVAHRVDPSLCAYAQCRFVRVPRPYGLHTVGEPLLDAAGRIAARRTHGPHSLHVVNGGNCLAAGLNWVHYVHAVYRPHWETSVRGAKRLALALRAERRERVALSRANLVIANSKATRQAVIERLAVPEHRVHTVYYGIDSGAFGAVTADERARARAALGLAERPAIAFVGALGDRRKGFDTLFAAFERLASDPAWDCDLLVIGTGSELSAWRARVAAAGLTSRVRLLGFRNDVSFVLAACDLLVAPTRYEAFGLGVLEALARGLPGLVPAHAGVAELYPRELEELLIRDVESSEGLAAQLKWWRSERESVASRMVSFAERVRARSWDQMASEIVAIAERLTGRSDARAGTA